LGSFFDGLRQVKKGDESNGREKESSICHFLGNFCMTRRKKIVLGKFVWLDGHYEAGWAITSNLSRSTRSQFHQCYKREFFVRTLFRQLFSGYMYVVKAAKTTFVWKTCVYTTDEIGCRNQFHQHFTHNFFVWKCFKQLFSSYVLAL